MLKLARAKPFFYQKGDRAVLLLHGFTGTPQDLKKLGIFLSEQGYSCYAPIYSGHGLGAEAILNASPQQWWQDAQDALAYLQAEGYFEVAIIGHSMGGIFTMMLAELWSAHNEIHNPQCNNLQIKGIVTLCSPVQRRPADELNQRLFSYARQYKQLQQKDPDQINYEIQHLACDNLQSLNQVSNFSEQAGEQLNRIEMPVFVVQGELDGESYKNSAIKIFSGVSTRKKYLKRYPQSGHLIMYGPEKEEMQQDILRFLNSLAW